MAQVHAGWRTAEDAEAAKQCFFQGTFGGLVPSAAFEGVPQNFAGTAVDDRDGDAPAIHTMMDRRETGGPAVVGLLSDRAADLDPRAATGSMCRARHRRVRTGGAA